MSAQNRQQLRSAEPSSANKDDYRMYRARQDAARNGQAPYQQQQKGIHEYSTPGQPKSKALDLVSHMNGAQPPQH